MKRASPRPRERALCRACLGLGANLGDREAHIRAALAALRARGVEIEKVSALLETEPVGGPPGQGRYLNGAALVRTALSPSELLRVLLDVECSLGRVRSPDERWAARTLDLDLLLYEDRVIESGDLVVPHPRLHERAFVLRPLAEIAPEWRHAVLGRSVRELLAALSPRSGLPRP